MQKSEIVHDILSYLAEHPKAQDTYEGIVEWWLLERKIMYQKELVKEVLEELIKMGLVFEYKGEDSRILFRMNQNKHEEIQILINK